MSKLVTMAKKGVRQIREVMEKPDQQWLPTLMYVSDDGSFDVIGIALGDGQPGAVTQDDIDDTGTFVEQRLREHHAVEAVFVSTVWLEFHGEDLAEAVMIAHVDRGSTDIQIARVKRTDGKPKLGEWQRLPGAEMAPMVVVDAMRAAI